MNFFDDLARRSRACDSLLCVGLDPAFERHQVEEVALYLRAIIAATAPFAACFKPNIAFYEQWGLAGLRALEETLKAIPADIPVIGDVKRGDVQNTAAAYARAMFEEWGFGAITVNPLLGRDSVEPFLSYTGRGVYVVCRTSNPGARDFEAQALESGHLLFEELALAAPAWSPAIGLVAGATDPADLRRVRELAPATPLLVPGVGPQGGDALSVLRAAGNEPGRVVVNASRSILYAGEGPGFDRAAEKAASALRDLLRPAPTPA